MNHEISNNLFEGLTSSAFNFFDRAIRTFDEEIDASIVHFATALELILKAQLVREHWAFIFNEIRQIDANSLQSGKFISIQASDLVKRINAVIATMPSEIGTQEEESYQAVFDHRNQVVHYINGSLLNKIECKKTKSIFLTAWYYLHKRLKNKLSIHFTVQSKNYLNTIFASMTEKEGFWGIVYNDKKALIDEQKSKGHRINKCDVCHQKSLLFTEVDRECGGFSDVSTHCIVCGTKEQYVACKCPQCGKFVALNSEEVACKSCGYEVISSKKSAIIEICDHHFEAINCGECGSERVHMINNSYYCANCLETYDDYFDCGYCQTIQTGSFPEDSFLSGCQFCGGKLGDLASKED